MNPVRGARRIAGLCLRCLAVLTVANLLVVLVGAAMGNDGALAAALVFYPYVLLVAAVLIAVIGFPAGLLVSHLMRAQPDERLHVLAFAIAGALLSVAICTTWAQLSGSPWFGLLVAAAEGALGAGGARWWSGRPRRARGAPTDEDVEDAAVSRAVES